MAFFGWSMVATSQPKQSLTPDIGQYKLGKSLGRGHFGEVKLGEHVITGQRVAVKVVPEGTMDDATLQREVSIQRRLNHPHVVKVYDCIKTEHGTFIAMELGPRGDLLEHLIGHVRLHEDEARRLFQQLLAAVEHCHSQGIAHRDLKPENILLDDHLNIKIADFGLSAEMVEGELLSDSCGSPNYAAPELLYRDCKYQGPEIDVWSCGVILYALLCNNLPFDAENIPDLYTQIKQGQYNEPGYLSSGSKDLLSRMLAVSPAKRISIPEIREHSWFKINLPTWLLEANDEASPEEVPEEMKPTDIWLSIKMPRASAQKTIGRHVGTVARSRSQGSRCRLTSTASACRSSARRPPLPAASAARRLGPL